MGEHHQHDRRRARTRRHTSVIFVMAVALSALSLAAASATSQQPAAVDSHNVDHEAGHDLGHPPGAVQRELAQVRAAISRYHTPERAEAAGWELVPGLDHCFEHDGVGGMGIHYTDVEQLESGTLDPLRPEALVFVPGPQGQLRLAAVEYIVPIEDPVDPGEPPTVLGRELHQLNPVEGVHVWGLHVWLFERNPAGMFADWNPRVSCPS